MLAVQRISKLDTGLVWFKLFFSAFRLKWKLELICYALIGIGLFLAAFSFLTVTGDKVWVLYGFAGMAGLITWPLVIRSARYSNVILRKLRIENHQLIPDQSFHSFYGIRVVLTKKELVECNSYSKEKIDELVNTFAAESSRPKYKFAAFVGFKAVFFMPLGAGLTFVFRSGQNDSFDSLFAFFQTAVVLSFFIALVVYGIEFLIIRSVFGFLVNRHFRADVVRYLKEVKMMIPES